MHTKLSKISAFADLRSQSADQKFLPAVVGLYAWPYTAAMRHQIEMLSFLKRRLEQDVKLVDDLVASDLSDSFDIVVGFMQAARIDYVSAAGKLASIGSKLNSATAHRMRKQADAFIEDFAAKTVA